MSLDGTFLYLLTNELRSAVGSRIAKITMPSKSEVMFTLTRRDFTKKLLINAAANSPRIHFAEESPESLPAPPPFAMLLRKLNSCSDFC